MIVEREEPGMHLICELVPMMLKYVRDHEDGADRLREFMAGPGLWDTSHVMEYTGWGRTHVQRLVSEGKIPYIPGKPNKFIPQSVRAALEDLEHNNYSKRKTTRRVKK